MDRHHLFLPLPPEAGIRLLIHFQGPHQRKPDQNVAASLDIDAMAHASGRNQTDLDLTGIPVRNLLIGFDVPGLIPMLLQVFPDTVMIVLVPVSYQYVLAVCLLDELG